MRRGCGTWPQLRQIVALENVEHLDERDAARAGRRHRDDLVAAIRAFHGRAADRIVILQILARDEAAVREHLLLQRLRRLALVETGWPLRGDPLERSRELR